MPTENTDKRYGLALSGGGIRSATFCLGVLQCLARQNRLASFDYLSTVSGGGYIGSWLSAWIHRTSLGNVQQQLQREGSATQGADAQLPRNAQDGLAANEPPEVTWLRKYSNYLAPRLGLLSADSLTLVTTWFRNVFLNLLVLLGFIATLLLVPYMLIEPIAWMLPHGRVFGYAAMTLTFIVFVSIGMHLTQQARRDKNPKAWLPTTGGVMLTVIAPSVLAALFGGVWLFNAALFTGEGAIAGLGIAGLLLVVLALIFFYVSGEWRALLRKKIHYAGEALVYLLAGAGALGVALALLWAVKDWAHAARLSHTPHAQHVALLVFGTAVVLAVYGVAGSVWVGLVGRRYFERSREWWSRMNAWLFTFAAAWAGLFGLALYGPALLEWGLDALPGWARQAVGAGWIGSLLGTLLARKPRGLSRTQSALFDRALNALAAIFVTGLLLVLSTLLHHALTGFGAGPVAAADSVSQLEVTVTGKPQGISTAMSVQPGAVRLTSYLEARLADQQALLAQPGWAGIGLVRTVFLAVLVALLYLSFRVDVNKFSLHNMYKNRLIRCYLGASRPHDRWQQPFTGFDEDDDVPLKDLKDRTAWGVAHRPEHFLNAAINISQGKNLAWQERKAAPFVFSAAKCGFRLAPTQGDARAGEPDLRPRAAFKETTRYATDDPEERGFTLGMALATSGAAVSPNMGRATQPVRAFLLTFFNVRLGRWSPNPARARATQPTPHFGLLCLLQELFGLSNEERKFVYLSDGGHFENLGLYTLVEKRCDVIWVVDAAADPEREFIDFAESVRKCRVDLGVEIEIDLGRLRGTPHGRRSEMGYAVGKIHYGGGKEPGTLVLLKPSLSKARDEPADVLGYASRNPTFPQQATTDQFFDESQFESYRRLGLHIGDQCFEPGGPGQSLPVVPVSTGTPNEPKKPSEGQWHLGTLYRPLWMGAVVLFVVMASLHAWLVPSSDFACFLNAVTWGPGEACVAVARAQVTFTGVQALLWADNIFVLWYVCAICACAWKVSVTRVSFRDSRLRFLRANAGFLLVCALALLAGFVDHAENFQVLALSDTYRAGDDPSQSVLTTIAHFTAWKFRLVAAALVALAAYRWDRWWQGRKRR